MSLVDFYPHLVATYRHRRLLRNPPHQSAGLRGGGTDGSFLCSVHQERRRTDSLPVLTEPEARKSRQHMPNRPCVCLSNRPAAKLESATLTFFRNFFDACRHLLAIYLMEGVRTAAGERFTHALKPVARTTSRPASCQGSNAPSPIG